MVSALDGRNAEATVAQYCGLAISAYTPEAEEQNHPTWVKDLWAKQFRCLAAVGDFNAAYACMMAVPMSGL